jgi:4-amino-4-deoxy-L-arabinose transferase-like glycosyltransferase
MDEHWPAGRIVFLAGLMLAHLGLQYLYNSYVDPLNRIVEADGHSPSKEETVTTLRLHHDEVDYYRIAVNCFRRHAYSGSSLSEPPIPTAYRPPLFPVLLASVFSLTGSDPRYGITLNSLLIASVIPLAYWLGLLVYDWRSGVLAAVFAALWPNGFYFGSTLLSEPLATVACTASFIALLLWARGTSARGESAWKAAAAGSILGAALLVRSNLTFVALMIAAWLIWCVRRRIIAFRHVAVFAVCVSAVLLPWGIRNYATMRLLTIGTTGGGDVFAGAHNDLVAAVSPGYWIPVPLPVEAQQLSEQERDAAAWKQGFDFIKRSSISSLVRLCAFKLAILWQPLELPFSEKNKKYWNWAASVIYLPAVIGSIVGCFYLSRHKDLLYLTIAYAAGLSLMTLVFCGTYRYMVPLQPIGFAIASFAIMRYFETDAGQSRQTLVLEYDVRHA